MDIGALLTKLLRGGDPIPENNKIIAPVPDQDVMREGGYYKRRVPTEQGGFLNPIMKMLGAYDEQISKTPFGQIQQTPRGMNQEISNKDPLSLQQKGERVLSAQDTRRPTPTSTPVPNPQTTWEEFTNLVREEAGQRGYNPDVLIRQKALESGFGNSRFARERNNFGGIGAYTENPEAAHTFESPQDYLEAYFNLIEDRFPQAYENRQDPEKYLQGLLRGTHGTYATDPNYVNKVLSTPLMPR